MFVGYLQSYDSVLYRRFNLSVPARFRYNKRMMYTSVSKRSFIYSFGALVLFPLMMTVMAYSEFWILGEPGAFNTLLFIPLTLYYAPPALIFGDTFYITSQGVGPSGIVGILLTCVFYTLLAYLISRLFRK